MRDAKPSSGETTPKQHLLAKPDAHFLCNTSRYRHCSHATGLRAHDTAAT